MADYLPPMAPVSTNTLSWLGESDYALASYRAFLRHARKPSSHDQRLPRHGVWPTCGPNCAAYIAHSFPGTLGLFCRTGRPPPHTNSAKPCSPPQETDTRVYGSFYCPRRSLDPWAVWQSFHSSFPTFGFLRGAGAVAGHRHACQPTTLQSPLNKIVLILRRARFGKPVRAWAAGVTAELRAPRLRRSWQLRLYTNP